MFSGLLEANVRFFDAGQEAHGFIAVGQFATGVIAIGQIATGVFAFGQMARGVVAIGQVSIGIFSVGMVSGGVCWAAAMLGVGGRGAGLVLPLIPSLGKRAELPEIVTPEAVLSGAVERGWIRGEISAPSRGQLVVSGRRGALPLRFDARLRRAVYTFAVEGAPDALIQVTRDAERDGGEGLLATKVMRPPASRLRVPGWWVAWAIQLLGLCALSVGFWALVARPLLVFLVRGEVVPL